MRFSISSITILMLVTTALTGAFLRGNMKANQGPNRVVEKRSTSPTPNEPVRLTAVRTRRKGRVELGKTFADQDDWFKDVAIEVQNTSKKNIVCIAIEVSFDRSENQATEPPFVHALRYGSRFPLTGDSADSNQIKPLKPGEIVDIILTDVTYDVVKKALNKLKYPASIERVEVYIAEVIFDDNTSWSAGRMFRSDPRNPDEWIPDEPEQGSAASASGYIESAFSSSILSAHLSELLIDVHFALSTVDIRKPSAASETNPNRIRFS